MATFFPHGTRSPRKTPADPRELYAVTAGLVIADTRRQAAAATCSGTTIAELSALTPHSLEVGSTAQVHGMESLAVMLRAMADSLERDRAYYLALEDDTGKNAMRKFIMNAAVFYSDKAEMNPEFDYLYD